MTRKEFFELQKIDEEIRFLESVLFSMNAHARNALAVINQDTGHVVKTFAGMSGDTDLVRKALLERLSSLRMRFDQATV